MAFERLKEVLTSELFLTHYNPDLDIIVTSDTSAYGIGAFFLHKMPDGRIKNPTTCGKELFPDRERILKYQFRGNKT